MRALGSLFCALALGQQLENVSVGTYYLSIFSQYGAKVFGRTGTRSSRRTIVSPNLEPFCSTCLPQFMELWWFPCMHWTIPLTDLTGVESSKRRLCLHPLRCCRRSGTPIPHKPLKWATGSAWCVLFQSCQVTYIGGAFLMSLLAFSSLLLAKRSSLGVEFVWIVHRWLWSWKRKRSRAPSLALTRRWALFLPALLIQTSLMEPLWLPYLLLLFGRTSRFQLPIPISWYHHKSPVEIPRPARC